MRRSTVLSLPLQLVFPVHGLGIYSNVNKLRRGRNHRYLKNQIAQVLLCGHYQCHIFGFFLLKPQTVLTRQKRQLVHVINQSIFLRCLWENPLNFLKVTLQLQHTLNTWTGNTKGGSINVPLTSCLTHLESVV